MATKQYKFFFHYNKPASKAAGEPVISVHWQGACHLVSNIVVNVPTWGKLNNRQPFFVIEGKAEFMDVGPNNVAFLYNTNWEVSSGPQRTSGND